MAEGHVSTQQRLWYAFVVHFFRVTNILHAISVLQVGDYLTPTDIAHILTFLSDGHFPWGEADRCIDACGEAGKEGANEEVQQTG